MHRPPEGIVGPDAGQVVDDTKEGVTACLSAVSTGGNSIDILYSEDSEDSEDAEVKVKMVYIRVLARRVWVSYWVKVAHKNPY